MAEDAALEAACCRVLEAAFAPEAVEASPLFGAAVVPLGLSFISRERGVAALESVLRAQGDDGRIPATAGMSGLVLPLVSSVFRWVFLSMPEHEPQLSLRVRSLLEPLDRLHRSLYDRSEPLYRAGVADDRVLGPGAADGVLDVGINAILVQAETDLMDVAMRTGHPAQEMLVRRTRRAATLVKRTWSGDDELYRSRDASGAVEPPGADGLLLLYCGAALPAHAAAISERYLREGKGFWSPQPLSTLPVEHPDYRPDEPGRGAVSPLLNWMLVDGLSRYGFEGRARALHDATLSLCRSAGIWEAYDASTGEGVGAPDAPVTAALILNMIRDPWFDRVRCMY